VNCLDARLTTCALCLRAVPTHRFEIFAEASKKHTCRAFDTLMQEVAESMVTNGHAKMEWDVVKDKIMSYAIKLAKRDPRVGDGHVFSSFAVIVSYGPSDEQYVHADTKSPNVQFCMAIMDKIPATRVFPTSQHIFNGKTMIEQLGWMSDEAFPASLKQQLLEDDMDILEAYGDLLLPDARKKPPATAANTKILRRASVAGVLGGVAHCGPSHHLARANLFYTSSRCREGTYDVDEQYCHVQVFAITVHYAWEDADLDSKKFLLGKLSEFVMEGVSEGGMEGLWMRLNEDNIGRGFWERMEGILNDKSIAPTDRGGPIKSLIDEWANKVIDT
jgi:hypothetical protein